MGVGTLLHHEGNYKVVVLSLCCYCMSVLCHLILGAGMSIHPYIVVLVCVI